MGHSETADLLEQTLEEEKAADEKLNEIAMGGINEDAASGARGHSEEGSGDGRSRGGSSQRGASQRETTRRSSGRSS